MKTTLLIALGLVMASCGSNYDKSAEDWRDEVCTCVQEKGAESCADVMEALGDYYGEDYETHDKTIHLITQSCPEVVLSVALNSSH